MKSCFFTAVFIILLLITGCGTTINEDSTASEMAALAERKLQNGDPERALELFSSALAAEPSNPQTTLWTIGKAESLFDLGRKDEALALISRYTFSTDPVAKARALLLKARIEAVSSPTSALNSLVSLNMEHLDSYRAEEAILLCREQLDHVQINALSTYRERGWLELYVLLELEERYAVTGDVSRATLY